MNEEKKYLKEMAGNSGHVIPHFGGTVPSPDSLSPQLLAQTAGYTQSVANLARDTVRTDSSRARVAATCPFLKLEVRYTDSDYMSIYRVSILSYEIVVVNFMISKKRPIFVNN
jgi:hypothetical protein